MIFIPKYFSLHEFLPRDFYNKYYPVHGEMLWKLFSYEILWTAQQLRMRYGRLDGNDWYWRDQKHPDGLDPDGNQWRGWRPFDCPVGAKISDHKRYGAFDLMPVETTAEAIRWDCLQESPLGPFKYITAIESGVSWFHFSIGNHNKTFEGIREF